MVLFVGHFAVVGKREGERAMTDADVDADTLFSVPCPLGKIRREMMMMPMHRLERYLQLIISL